MPPDTPSPRPFSWRPRAWDVAAIVALFALSRVVLILVGTQAWGAQVASTTWRGVDGSRVRYALVDDDPYLDMWARWDSWQYEEIARQGYWYDFNYKPRPYGTVACFPLYPLAVRAVGRLPMGRWRYVIAGLAVSNLSALAGFVLLFQWARWKGDRRAAWLAVATAIASPPGLFWSALYPQSLFFALTIGACLLMLNGRVAWASLLGALATAARPEGIAIVPTLAALHLQGRRWRLGRESLWLLLTPLGLLAYMAYLQYEWGDATLFMKVQALFSRQATNPLATLIEPLHNPVELRNVRTLLTYAVGIILLLAPLARLPLPLLLYAWSLFLIPLSTGVYESIYRIHLVNFPIYLAVGLGLRGRWRILGWGIVLLFAFHECTMMYVWVAGYRYP